MDAGRLSLSPNEIHLWLTRYESIGDARLHAAYREMLDPAERAQEPRFHFARDRRRYLVTRALVRTVLSRHEAVAPNEWIFATNAWGRPEVANEGVRESGLSFNLSHTHSLIVLGVTRDRALGVDVENVSARQVSIDIADRYFAPEEVSVLNAVAPELQQYRFFEYWTFKESYIKARGMGLSLPLDKFAFRYPGEDAVEIAIDPELEDDASRWRLWQFRPWSEYLAAVCAETLESAAPEVIVRQAIPLVGDERVEPRFLRVSDGAIR